MKMRVVRRRITVFGGILLAIILILLVLLVIQRHSNDQDAVERKHKEAQFQKQQDEEIALKEKLNNLNDKDYIEKFARDDYYLSNKGEVILDYQVIINPLNLNHPTMTIIRAIK